MHRDILKLKWFWIVVGGILEIILLLLVFRFGMVVGFQKANFNENWGRNYGRFFGEPRQGFFTPDNGGIRSAFGNAGTVISVGSSTIVIKSNDNNEKTIAVTTSTVIRAGASTLSLGDIKVGDPLVAIGEPGQNGEIVAAFIRVFPSNPSPGNGPAKFFQATGTNQ